MRKKPLHCRFTKARLERQFLRHLEKIGAPPLLVVGSRNGETEVRILRLTAYPGLPIEHPGPVGAMISALVKGYAQLYEQKFGIRSLDATSIILDQLMNDLGPEIALIEREVQLDEGRRVDN